MQTGFRLALKLVC